MKAKKRLLVVALIMTLVLLAFTFSPTAAALLSRNGNINLNLSASNTGRPLENVSIKLYCVAKAYQQPNGGVRYEFIPPYDEANIDLNNLQDYYLPIHLNYFATSRNLPYTEKTTNKNGDLVFDDLPAGLFLVVPEHDIGNYFAPSPFIINIPQYDPETNVWEYDVTATPKIESNDVYDTDETPTYMSVVKLWEGPMDHPQSVTIVLLRDFQEYDKIQLGGSNNWHYRWDGLSKKHVWSIVEKDVPDGYTASYDSSSNTVTIVNTATPPDGEETTRPSGGEDDTTKPSGDDGGKTTKPVTEEDKLVQTGQLNWPIPVAAISGLLLFSLGWAILNLSKKANT